MYCNSSTYVGLFGVVGSGGQLININVIYNTPVEGILTTVSYIGGLVGYTYGRIDNCHVYDFELTTTIGKHVGGVIGYSRESVTNCSSVGGAITHSNQNPVGGIVGAIDYSVVEEASITDCWSSIDINVNYTTSSFSYCGGIIGYFYSAGNIERNYYQGVITCKGSYVTVGGICGYAHNKATQKRYVRDNYFNGELYNTNNFGWILGTGSSTTTYYLGVEHNLVRGKGYYTTNYGVGRVMGTSSGSSKPMPERNIVILTMEGSQYYYICNPLPSGSYSNANSTATTLETLQNVSTYSSWSEFDTYWYFIDNVNDGIPMLRTHYKCAQVTGFDGSGTQADPYQIKTTADLQGMQAYYNEYDMIDEYWWKLVNNINISTDANGLTLNWTPIGYEDGVASGFNGHFDGNGKTISGLTITEQYENVGLFGRLASNATITNLNVSGTISWDQGKYVGGVVGHMEDGATLTNCTFTGTINGYLNSGNYAIVGGLAGRYSTDAITGSANYETYVYGANSYTTFNRYTTTYNVY